MVTPKTSSLLSGTQKRTFFSRPAMMTPLNAGNMRLQLTTGSAPTQSRATSLPSGVLYRFDSYYVIEIDFDRTGRYMVSCGEDKNWMIWDIKETNFENKGMISGLHSRPIYSCTWSKGVTKGSDGAEQELDLIATVRSDYH